MTRDEKQLIRQMNKSFKNKKWSRIIKINDSTGHDNDDQESNDLIGIKDELHAYNLNPNHNIDFKIGEFTLSEDEYNDFRTNVYKKIAEESAKLGLTGNDSLILEEDSDNQNKKKEEPETKPLIQHFTLDNPWLPYENDIRLTRFVINQDNDAELEFEIIFNRPPHLRHDPSDLNNPLKIINQFKNLMDGSQTNGNNFKCIVSYSDAPDDALLKNFTFFNISGKIASMEILQNYGFGLRIKVNGRILTNNETRR